MFKQVALIGTGMIGGSLGLAIRSKFAACKVIGYDILPKALTQAKELGICHATTSSFAEAVSAADLVLFASPVHLIADQILEAIGPARPGTIFSDVGSTKLEICEKTQPALAGGKVHFVPGHPIAGSERSGPSAARGDLFEGRLTILCPMEDTLAKVTQLVHDFWQTIGARVELLSPQEHDRIFALTSHLPHLIAYALAGCLDAKHAPFTGGGFRDTTRVAQSDPNLWTEIFRSNRNALLKSLDSFKDHLAQIEKALQEGHMETVRELLTSSQAARKQVQ